MHVQGAPRLFFYLFLCICLFSDRLVKLLIRAVNLNEEQRKEVERSLTQTVQHYLKFHHHPTVEPLRNTLLHSTRCPWSLSVLVLLSSQWNALH